jgi:hypothetical protein
MNARVLLPVSLIVNAALAVALAATLARRRPPADPAPTTVAAAVPAAPRLAARSPAAAAAVTNAPEAPDAPPKGFHWQQVESADYKQYIANLRAIGCPEETIRDIVVADVNKLFAERAKTLTPKKKFEYWKTGNVFADLLDEEGAKRGMELDRERRALLKDLLGVEPEAQPGQMLAAMNVFETMLDFLPAEKRTRLMEVEQEFGLKQAKLFQGGMMDADDQQALRALQKEKQAALRAALSPKEHRGYELRMSETAMMLRHQLTGFDTTEQEFQQIFDRRKAFDEEFGLHPFDSDREAMNKRGDAEAAMKEDLKQLLGEPRYAEYERAQDYTWQSLNRIAERNGLPKDAAAAAYEMKREAENEAGRIRLDASLNEAQREAALLAVQQETMKALNERLGEKATESWRKSPGGFWMQNLANAPRPPRPAQDAVIATPPAGAGPAADVEVIALPEPEQP